VVLTPTLAALGNGAANADAEADPAREACLRYVKMEDMALSLLDEWPKRELALAQAYPGFLKLSDDEKKLIPGGGRFLEIQEELEVLDAERDKLLPQVVELKCKTPGAVMAKLMLVERLICADDHPEVKKLVADAIEDLDRLLPF